MQGLEWIILLIALVVIFAFGGKKLPELARSLGRAKGEFERGKMEIERELRDERSKDLKKEEGDIVKAAQDLGIDTQGKSEEELKKEIKEKL
ncbi:MAG: twin-arginine translocase TatA/TatE family subunit [Thermoplasmata archaeon]|nr:MAG: twin-arginine translocase TatA/TatE family subunit [Thermoplasmata archaeon]